jgi:hypothetical protein
MEWRVRMSETKYMKILKRIKKYNTRLEVEQDVTEKDYETATIVFKATIGLSKNMLKYIEQCELDGISFEASQDILERYLTKKKENVK